MFEKIATKVRTFKQRRRERKEEKKLKKGETSQQAPARQKDEEPSRRPLSLFRHSTKASTPGKSQSAAENAPGLTPGPGIPSLDRIAWHLAKPSSRRIPEAPTNLLAAAQSGSEGAVRRFLKTGADINARDAPTGLPALHLAARAGHEQVVRLLLEAGAPPSSAVPDTGVTALHWAAERGHPVVAVRLMKAGARVDARTAEFRMTPLHEAARNGRGEVVRVLLRYGADRWAKNVNGATALELAADVKTGEVFRTATAMPIPGAAAASQASARRGTGGAVVPAAASSSTSPDGITGKDLLYDEPTWNEYWEESMEKLRRGTYRVKTKVPAELTADEAVPPKAKPGRSQNIVDAVYSEKLSDNAGWALL